MAQPAPTLLWSAPGIENVVSVAWIEDIDGDGGPDVLFESYDAGAPATDHLFAIQGRSNGTGTVLWSARPLGGPSNSGGYGDNCLRVGPDLTGDGFPEVLLGCAWGSRTAFSLDGLSGETDWSFDTYAQSPPTPPRSGWVYAMESLGQDITGDGVPEVLFCVGSENDGVYCVNGADGSVIWRYQGPDAFFDVISIEDLNGDGVRDVVAGVGDSSQRTVALNGANGGALWQRTSGSVFDLARLEDRDGDKIPEIVSAAWDGQIHAYSGRTGATIWDGLIGDSGMRVVTLDDVSGDQVEDLAVGSWDNAARVYSGATGGLIWRTPVGTLNGGDVWAIDRVDDITGDDINDVCCGSFDGYVYLMDGVTGEIVWRYNTGHRLYTVRGVPDISGNGVPDVVAGTQKLSTGGVCYAFEGGEGTVSVEGRLASPGALSLSPNYPNPFTPVTRWTLRVHQPGEVELLLFNSTGRRVAVLPLPEASVPGEYRLTWEGEDQTGQPLPSGVYHARARVNGRVVAEQKAVLVR